MYEKDINLIDVSFIFHRKLAEDTVEKREIPPFPTVFSIHLDNFLPFLLQITIVVCKLFQFGRV